MRTRRFARLTMRPVALAAFALAAIALIIGCGSPNDPDTPGSGGTPYLELGSTFTRGFAQDVALDGTTAYVAENSAGVAKYDFSNPASIQMLDSTGTNGNALMVRVLPEKNALFVTTSDFVYVHWLDDLSFTRGQYGSSQIRDMLLFPDTATVTFADFTTHSTTGIRSIRADESAEDGLMITFVFPDSNYLNSGDTSATRIFNSEGPFNISFRGNGIQGLASLNDGLQVAAAVGDLGVAIANLPVNPVAMESMGTWWISDVDTPGEAQKLVAQDGWLYVADGVGGLAVIDVHDPNNPVYVRSWKISGLDHADNIAVDGTRLVLVDQYDGLYFLDITDPGNPAYMGERVMREPTSAHFMDNGNLVVTSKTEGVTIFQLLY